MPSTSSPPASFEAHIDVSKIRVQMAMGVVGSCGALYALWQARTAADNTLNAESLVPVAIILLVFIVFSGLLFKGVRDMLRANGGGVALRIDEHGVFDKRLDAAPYPWSAIEGAELIDIAQNRHTTRSREDGENANPVMVVKLQVTGQGAVTIESGALDTSAQAIFDAIQEHRAHFGA